MGNAWVRQRLRVDQSADGSDWELSRLQVDASVPLSPGLSAHGGWRRWRASTSFFSAGSVAPLRDRANLGMSYWGLGGGVSVDLSMDRPEIGDQARTATASFFLRRTPLLGLGLLGNGQSLDSRRKHLPHPLPGSTACLRACRTQGDVPLLRNGERLQNHPKRVGGPGPDRCSSEEDYPPGSRVSFSGGENLTSNRLLVSLSGRASDEFRFPPGLGHRPVSHRSDHPPLRPSPEEGGKANRGGPSQGPEGRPGYSSFPPPHGEPGSMHRYRKLPLGLPRAGHYRNPALPDTQRLNSFRDSTYKSQPVLATASAERLRLSTNAISPIRFNCISSRRNSGRSGNCRD